MTKTNLANTGDNYTQKIEKFDSKYLCLFCNQLLKRPVQIECGHRMCFSCLEDLKMKFSEYTCKICNETTELSKAILDKGFQNDMSRFDTFCDLCEWKGKLINYEEHLEQKHQQLKCEYCGEIFSTQLELKEHENKLCEKKLLSCPLHEFGCKTKFVRSQRSNHFASEEHQKMVSIRIEYFQSKTAKNDFLTQTIENTNMDIDVSDREYCANSIDTQTAPDDMQRLNEMVDVFSNGIYAIGKDLDALDINSSEELQSLEQNKNQLEKIQTSIEESNNISNGMDINLSIIQQELIALKEKYDNQYVASYNGTFVWKITGFREKMNDAQSERQVSVYSPPFYSSPTGYKMCARLYLYGDGNARRTHMSLFFILMRGPHDSLLSFPFNYKVTFCLYDQTNAQRHIIDSFRPDIRSSSFQRPCSTMNIASGIPKFAPLSIISDPNTPYVKDDSMFIKIMVDFENIPKITLPYAIKLNPGLPMHVQQKLIWKKLEEVKSSS